MRTRRSVIALLVFGLTVAGPVASAAAQTDADIVQEGDNEGSAQQTGALGTGDGAAGAQITGVVQDGGSTSVRKSNTSEDGEATSGDTTVTSEASVRSGDTVEPQTVGTDAASCEPFTTSIDGPVTACIVHDGDNTTETTQSAAGTSGDAVASSQVSGIVNTGGTVVVDLTNIGEGAEATSGNASGTSDVSASAFDSGLLRASLATSITGPYLAGVVHEGDNTTAVGHDLTSATGDAVAGGQITGLVGAGDVDLTADNASEDDQATSGDATSAADVHVASGDHAPILNAAAPADASIDGPGTATIVHDGDNDANVRQAAAAATGDAVAGGQVTGAVTAAGGSFTGELENASEDGEATTGDADAVADIDGVLAGDTAPALVAAVGVGDASIEGPTAATTVHDGDNEASATQAPAAATGDAVAGGQVTGVVSAGDTAVAASNDAEDAEAVSGDATATDAIGGVLAGDAAPNTIGVTFVGDPVGIQSIGGPTTGIVVHEGDNTVDTAQDASAASGDAVAGGQVTGAVTASGGTTAVDATNTSEDAGATSGDATAADRVAGLVAGDVSPALVAVVAVGELGDASIDGPTNAAIVHEGDNDVASDQAAAAASGDAVAGGSVTGVVGAGDTAVVLSNTSDGDEATSGDADATNALGGGLAGDATASNVSVVAVGGPELSAIEDATGGGVIHEGDNAIQVAQTAGASSGDAVAGGQIAGAVTAAGGSASIDATNASEDGTATSGAATAENNVTGIMAGDAIAAAVGVIGVGGPGGFSIANASGAVVHEGDNDSAANQDVSAGSGDAVAGGQVAGVVSSGDTSVVLDNTSEDADATSGDTTANNAVGGILAGDAVAAAVSVVAVGGGAASIDGVSDGVLVHEGDNDAAADQQLAAATGDAVAGGQVAGVVSAGDTSIVLDNTSEDAEATSGDTAAANAVAGILAGDAAASAVGVIAVGGVDVTSIDGPITARVVHDGDNDAATDQQVAATTGDAVAGGQVAGAVTAAGGSTAIDATSASEDDQATSGDTDATNTAGGVAAGDLTADTVSVIGVGDFTSFSIDGPTTARIVHDGDNEAGATQRIDATTGDAVAGGQVAGVVSAGDTSLVLDNTSEDADATSGDTTAANSVEGILAGDATATQLGAIFIVDTASIDGPTIATIVHEGDNDASTAQQLAATTGDAVAGGQVAGAVTAAGGSAAVDATNTSEDDQATSGDTDAINTVRGVAAGNLHAETLAGVIVGDPGLFSIEGPTTALIVHEGDNQAGAAQRIDAATGDAVAGGQVAGLVTSGDAAVVLDNTSEDAEATSGDVDATNTAGGIQAGAEITATLGDVIVASIEGPTTAVIVHDGDNDAIADQSLSVGSGDAVAGGQIVGGVIGGTADVSQENASDGDESTTGDVTGAGTLLALHIGPVVSFPFEEPPPP